MFQEDQSLDPADGQRSFRETEAFQSKPQQRYSLCSICQLLGYTATDHYRRIRQSITKILKYNTILALINLVTEKGFINVTTLSNLGAISSQIQNSVRKYEISNASDLTDQPENHA